MRDRLLRALATLWVLLGVAARRAGAAVRHLASPRLRRLRRAGLVTIVLVAAAATFGAAVAALLASTVIDLRRFERAEGQRATLLYAAGQTLAPGTNIRAVDLAGTLARLRYSEVRGTPSAPGQFRRAPGAWEVYTRGLDVGGERRPLRVRLLVAADRITRIVHEGENLPAVSLEPEVLTSAADRPGEESRPVRLAEVPLVLLHAVLAAEDHRFFDHHGLDLHGLLRAVWVNLRAGRFAQGGSTITQQLVKNRLVGAQRTLGRKLREAWLAAMVEWRYSKEQILEAYLNEMYLGQRGGLAIRGMGAAARAYFRKEIHQLTLGEAALLAGMIRAPNSYSPVINPERAYQRRDVVLARMREIGRISAAEQAAARREPIRVAGPAAPGQMAPYFTDYVRQEMEQRLGDDLAGARVLTTLDVALQRSAESAVNRGLERLEAARPRLRRREATERLQAVLIAIEPATGRIRALVGGRDYQTSQFNRVVSARRQPGSAFKPFVYLAALGRRDGGGPAFTAATPVDDSPLALMVGQEEWVPRNYEDRYEGRVPVRRALEQSLNAATVRIALEVGLPAVIDTARRLGVASRLSPVPAMVLGAFEVTPLELATAYLPLASGGLRPEAVSAVAAAWDGGGAALPLPSIGATEVVPPAEAYVVTSLLEGAVNTGTGAQARALGVTGAVAGKTGTTNDGRDAWFVGYTPHLLALVWVGYDSNEPHGLSAAQAALPIWADFMRQALEVYPAPPAFPTPAGVTTIAIDPTNGRAATRWCPLVAREVFLTGTEPQPCDEHGFVTDHIVDWWRRFRDWLGR